jgi:hypothetical protein
MVSKFIGNQCCGFGSESGRIRVILPDPYQCQLNLKINYTICIYDSDKKDKTMSTEIPEHESKQNLTFRLVSTLR